MSGEGSGGGSLQTVCADREKNELLSHNDVGGMFPPCRHAHGVCACVCVMAAVQHLGGANLHVGN